MNISSEAWQAIGTLGQWAAAIATTSAVLVALKPYKRKIVVQVLYGFLESPLGVSPTITGRIINKGFTKTIIQGGNIRIGKCDVINLPSLGQYPHELEPERYFEMYLDVKDIMQALAANITKVKEEDPVHLVFRDQCGREYRKKISSNLESWAKYLSNLV